jgi:hypothetical protein
VNFYREPSTDGYLLRSVLGMEEWVDLARVWVRAICLFGNDVLAVCGGHVFLIKDTGTWTDIGTIGDSVETSVAVNTGYATIVAGGKYYTLKDNTLTEVSVVTLGAYTVVSELNGRRVAWSALTDPTTFPGLNFRSAELNDDPVTRLEVFAETLIVLKSSGFERWGLTGAADADAIANIAGAMVETGLLSFPLLVHFQNGFAFAATDGRIHAWNGAALQPISNPPVEVALSDLQPQVMFYYSRRGHGFICVKMKESPAWCYDVATGEWHEREEDGAAWSASCSVQKDGVWIVGTDFGKLVKMTTLCEDWAKPMVRRAVSKMLNNEARFRVGLVEAFTRKGVDLQSSIPGVLSGSDGDLSDGTGTLGYYDGDEAKITLRTSHDGVVFGPEKVRSLGAAGHYADRITWRQLGQFRRLAIELTLSCRNDVPLLASVGVQ